MPAGVAAPVPPFDAIPPVSESEPRAATVPSAVTRVVPIDELFRLLVMDAPAPAFIVGERNGGQRQIDDYRQGDSQQSKSRYSRFEHGSSLLKLHDWGLCEQDNQSGYTIKHVSALRQ